MQENELTLSMPGYKRLNAANISHLFVEEQKKDFDLTGRALYLTVCKTYGVIPVSYFMRHMQDAELNLSHHGLGSLGAKAMSHPLMVSNMYIHYITGMRSVRKPLQAATRRHET